MASTKKKPDLGSEGGEVAPYREAPASKRDRKAPAEWAALLGTPDWHVAAASALHRWDDHEHHMGGPIQLTEDDYLSACTAVVTHQGKPGERPRCVPHGPAFFEPTPALAERIKREAVARDEAERAPDRPGYQPSGD